MRRNNLDIFLAIFVGLVSVLLVLLGLNLGGLNIALGLLLVFVLPGYVVSMALFPESNWSVMERTILTIGLSLVLSILGGIVLYAVSIRLQRESWAIFFGCVLSIAGFVAVFRRMRVQQAPSRRKRDTIPTPWDHALPKPQQLILLGLSALIILGAIAYAQNVAASYPKTEIVQLWILPAESKPGPSIRLGVMANEFAPLEYSLWLERGGYTVQTWPHLILKPGERWEVVIPVDSNIPGAGPLEAYLYRYDQPMLPYRHVILWLDQLNSK